MVIISNAPQLTRIHAWFSAVANDDTDLLAGLLAHGIPIDALHPLRHSSALMEATRLGRTGTVRWLLEHGATPAFLCGLPLGTALHCAMRRQHWNIARILAAAMNNCMVMDAYAATPLHALCTEATSESDATIVLGLASIVIKKKCPLDALDREGTTALHHCVINGNAPLASMLLRHGANPNAFIPDSQVGPLTIAALEKNLAMASLLLQFGADPNARTRDGTTPVSICPAIAQLINEAQVARGDVKHADMVH